jgi:PAS domain S-box-containing protein
MSYLKEELYELIKMDNSIFDFIQESALDGLWYWDLEKPEEEWMNPKFWTTLGYDPLEMPHKSASWQDIIHAEDLKKASENFTKHCENPSHLYEQIVRYKHKNGTTVWIKCSGKAIRDADGKAVRMLGAHTDITYLKKQEDLLLNCNSAARIGYWEVDLIAQTLHWSPVTKEIHEVSADYEPDLETAINFYKEGDSKEQIIASVELAIKEGKHFDHRLQIVTAENNNRWVRSIGQTEFSEGKCIRVYGTFQDITAEKKIKLDLIQEKEKLQSVLEGTNAGTWEWNIQTGEAHFNRRWAEIIGYTLEELEPISIQTWIDLAHPDDLITSGEQLNDCFEKKSEFYNCECRMKHKNGEWIWVLDRGKVISWTDEGLPLMMYGTHSDISEYKKTYERNKLFIEQTPTAIAMFDTNLCYLASSEKWRDDYGLQDKNIIGKSHYEIFPEIGEEWKKIHRDCLKGVRKSRDEDKFVRSDGTFHWLKWEVKPWYADNGNIGGLIMYTTDITARKKTEEQLRISEEAFRGNFESAAIGMALLNESGQWLKVNKSLCEIVGYNEEELMQLTFQDITHPADLDLDLKLLRELINDERSFYHMEKRYICKDGSIVYIILAASAVRDENKKVLYFISQIIDITAQKKAEQELEQALSKIQGIFDASTQVSIIETDIDGIITTFSVGSENLLGYQKEDIIFLKTPETIHLKEEIVARGLELSAQNNAVIEGFNVFTHAANQGEFETREWTYVRKDGSQFPVQLTVTAVKNKNIIVGYLGIAVDISAIKKVEDEIQSLLEVTKDQNERLKNFAHIVSHNLRSHSGNIAMMLDLLLHEDPAFSENEIIQLLGDAANNLKETIAHLNEVVLMNTTISENLTTINLQKSVEASINGISAIAKISNVTIYNEVDPELTILGIPAYIDSILLNFLSNAVKYKSDKHPAHIKLFTEIENDFVVLHIEDNGLGIDLKKNGAKLFGMYKTFHGNSDARGIGLFITKNQIEAISGKIKVTSELNKGTTFKLYFKYA